MYKIGDFSSLNKVSAKALRHYEKIGLLIPSRIDPKTGYRYYTDNQITHLKRIQLLKDIGFSLSEIIYLLNEENSAEKLIDALKVKRFSLGTKIKFCKENIAKIDSFVHELIDGVNNINDNIVMNEVVKIYSAKKHYDLLATTEPDIPILQKYMAQWDGDLFFQELLPYENRKFLEVGIGVGRIAKKVLEGGGFVTGIDISKKSLCCACEIFKAYSDKLKLISVKIEDFDCPNEYDVVYSVLTFLHIKDKEKALSNMVKSLVRGGKVVLSIEINNEDYKEAVFINGNERYRAEFYPNDINMILETLKLLNCKIHVSKDLVRTMLDEGKRPLGETMAKLIVAEKL